MKKYFLFSWTLVILSSLILSCSNNTEEENSTENKQIEISKDQFESEKMQIGSIQKMTFNSVVELNGYVYAPLDAVFQISTSVGGIVENIRFKDGDFVKKGQILFYIYSAEVVQKQQELAETSILLSKLKSDLDRVRTLAAEKVIAEKELLNVESDYKSAQAKYQSLKIQLSKLNLNTAEIEKGNYYSSIPILAPASGIVSSTSIVSGKFIDSNADLVEITDVSKLELKLTAFEKDLRFLKQGQEMEVWTLNNKLEKNLAQISKIGATLNNETGGIDVFAEFVNQKDMNLVNSVAIEASINTGVAEVYALPETAISKSEKKYYVLVLVEKKDGNFITQKKDVTIGRSYNGYVEVIGISEKEEIIVTGIQNIVLE
jgi:membrane fusion protein, heavy metal efflux system